MKTSMYFNYTTRSLLGGVDLPVIQHLYPLLSCPLKFNLPCV
jgi:hypothetical protein